MKNLYLYIILAFAFTCALQAQTKKKVNALQISTPLQIDGVLNEDEYSKVLPAKDFTQIQPYNGQPSYQASEVWFFYDQSAIYVGAMLFDNQTDSIFNYLTQRDDIGMSDYFGVYFDPYNQGLLAYGFFITPAGVQTDIKANKSDGDREDPNWNAVWESKTKLTEKGWTVEMKIPFSALRFSEKSGDVWGMNMFRNIRRYNSNNSWNALDRTVSGFIHQQGELVGISGVKAPVRLSLSPYIAGYYEPQNSGDKTLFKGGLDVKYGINDAITLDMMLIPDFGQIQSDDQELNLSPYEIHYNEKRQFFTEGTELFQRADIFYSRRIGSSPKFSGNVVLNDSEEIKYSPAETQLINATKISGRTTKGLGIGILNAMSLPASASIEDMSTGVSREEVVQPFTNYNVMVLDHSLKNNSFVSIINTNVSMWDNPFSANVTATQFELRDKSMSYALKGMGAVSTRGADEMENGFNASLALEKNKGKFYWGIKQIAISDKYNPNDLGYLQRNNQLSTETWLYYQMIQPNKIFREWNADIWYNHERLFNPSVFTNHKSGYDFNSRFKNNYSLVIQGSYTGEKSDYYEPRVEGRFFTRPAEWKNSIVLNTDSRKRFSLEFGNEIIVQPFSVMFQQQYHTQLNLRVGQRFNISYLIGYQFRESEKGFAGIVEEKIIFGLRDVSTTLSTLESAYVINNTMGISCRVRHYWSAVENDELYLLQQNGSLTNISAENNYDLNYNAFNVDMIYRWVFAPGSELSLAWKTNSYLSEDLPEYEFLQNIHNSWHNQSNSISLKVLLYLDNNQLLQPKHKKS